MSEEKEEVGPLGLISENIFISFEKASNRIKENYPRIKESVKKKIRTLFKFLIVMFLAGFTLILIGLHSESGFLLIIGRLILLPVVFVLFAIAALPAIVFESIGAKKITGEKYTTFIRHFFAYQLFLNLILLLPWVKINYQLYFYLMAATCTLTIVTALATELKLLKFATSIIVIAIIGTLVFPSGSKMLSRYAGDINKKAGEARLKHFTIDELVADKVSFYSEGKPAAWFCVDDDGKYVLYIDEDFCENNGKKMQPITEHVRKEIKKYKEKIISPRNLIIAAENQSPTPTPTPDIASNPSPTPAPEPTPETSSSSSPVPPSQYSNNSGNSYPPPDDRKEFAVVVMDDRYNQNRTVGEEMITWLGSHRAINAYDYLDKIHVYSGSVDLGDQQKLSKVAKKIIYATYQTRLVREDQAIKYCSASVIVKVIDAGNGNIIKEINRTYSAQSGDVRDGFQIALGFAFKAIENQFRKYM